MTPRLAGLVLGLAGCGGVDHTRPPGVMVVVQEQQAAWIRNFNPFLPVGGARWPANAGVHEPLLVYNPMKGEYTPWLAESYRWAEPARVLEFTLREGLRFSDGEALTAADVAFTFALLKENPALDTGGAWKNLSSVEADGERTVRVTFARPFAPGLLEVAHVPIVPEHVWSQVEDPVAFANPDPVGSGPFTEVLRFETQLFELGRNPHYWQGEPGVAVLRFPTFSSNDQANLALVQGDIDWAGTFVPAVERTFEARDPEHRDAWFPVVGDTVFLYPNTTTPPMDDPAVRKALSLAIDREMVVKVAMYDYTVPAHPTGLSDGYGSWRLGGVPAADDWVRHDPAAAGALLDAAGWMPGPDGMRRNEEGTPLRVQITTPAGWSDWVRAAQVVRRDLETIGVQAEVKGYDFSAWFDRVQRGEFSLTLGWSQSGPTPYRFYRALMGSASVKPVGEASALNWHRYGSERADALFAAFEATSDEAEQRALAQDMQRAFLDEAPAIPLFPSASWGEANSLWVTGFPSEADPYARLSPNHGPEHLLVMARLRSRAPREGS